MVVVPAATFIAHNYNHPPDPDEFADAFRRRIELQFGVERDFEKAVLDFVIGEIGSLGSASAADVGIFGFCGQVADNGKCCEDHRRRFAKQAHAQRAFWSRTLENGDIVDGDLETAIGLMSKHRALEDTIERARHYGAIAKDALALFPDSAMKAALIETVEFCIRRAH